MKLNISYLRGDLDKASMGHGKLSSNLDFYPKLIRHNMMKLISLFPLFIK